jgi:hypothetical protein
VPRLSTPKHVKHEIPAVARVEVVATSTASSSIQEILYGTTPPRDAVNVDEQEKANSTARRFGTKAGP